MMMERAVSRNVRNSKMSAFLRWRPASARLSAGPTLAAVALVWASACASTATHHVDQAPALAAGSADDPYQAAVGQAAVGASASAHPLRTIPTNEDRVVVVAWTDWNGYKPGPMQMGVDVWVTKVPEVQEVCRSVAPEVQQLRLQQLLGLPTNKNYDRFVVMEASRSEIFRPCPDPNPGQTACGVDFPADASVEHKAWIGSQAIRSYRVHDGFPWTRLGYTFDWNRDKSDRYGVSEFVIRKGATVVVKKVVPTSEYCAPISAELLPGKG
jgi:hypothetical protein